MSAYVAKRVCRALLKYNLCSGPKHGGVGILPVILRQKSTSIQQSCINFKPSPGATSIPWNYTDKGPEKWKEIFVKEANGQKQSPVVIETANAEYNSSLVPMKPELFNQAPEKMLISNSGNSVSFEVQNGYTVPPPYLPGKFAMVQFHFHWGIDSNCCGSEHVLDGQRFFAELHVVHYNTKYPSVAESLDHADGLAVLGVFVQATGEQENTNFNKILSSMEHVRKKGTFQILDEPFSPAILFPKNLSDYYAYDGSLTTPLFNESVLWRVFKQPIQISNKQANQLSNIVLSDEEGHHLCGNFRPEQPLCGRKLYKSFS